MQSLMESGLLRQTAKRAVVQAASFEAVAGPSRLVYPPTTPRRDGRRAFHSSRTTRFSSSRPAHNVLTDSLDVLVPALQALPPAVAPYLPAPLSAYPISTSLVLLTVALRSTITLPVSLWQRARSRRMATEVVPVWEQMKKELPLRVRARCRRAGKSYEQFKVELDAEMKKELQGLLRKHRCTPLPSMLVPLAIQIPLFLTMSYLIRQACLSPEFYNELLPWSTWSFTGPSPEQQQQLEAFAQSASILRDRGMNEETLAQLMGPRGDGYSGGGIGTTLAGKDSSMQGPIALGMITLLNAELNAYRTTKEREAFRRGQEQDAPKQAVAATTTPTPSPSTVSPASRDYRARPTTPTDPAPSSKDGPDASTPEPTAQEQRVSLRTAIFTNTLRVAAIAFVPIASQVPGGLLVYWLSSATFTLGQNSILDWRERRQAAQLDRRRTGA